MNARFWIYENNDWVKITLQPNQSLSHTFFQYEKEGWSRDSFHFIYDGDFVYAHYLTEACDCDGRINFQDSFRCHKMRLFDKKCVIGLNNNELLYSDTMRQPDWKLMSRSQRDYIAESMGY